FFGWLDERRNSPRNVALAEVARALLPGFGRRHSDRALSDATHHLCLFRVPTRRFRPGARKPAGNDNTAHGTGAWRDLAQRSAHPRVAMARQLPHRQGGTI